MTVEVRIISIGALASHPLRKEVGDRRPGHATTTLLISGENRILIDPSLPPDHLRQRLDERTGEAPEAITHVFLTDLRPDRRRGLSLFPEAEWLVGEAERDAYRAALREKMVELDDDEELDPDTERLLEEGRAGGNAFRVGPGPARGRHRSLSTSRRHPWSLRTLDAHAADDRVGLWRCHPDA